MEERDAFLTQCIPHRVISNSQDGTIEDIDRNFNRIRCYKRKSNYDSTMTGLDEPNKLKSGHDFLHSRASLS